MEGKMFKIIIKKSVFIVVVTALFLLLFTACELDDSESGSVLTNDKIEATSSAELNRSLDAKIRNIKITGAVVKTLKGVKAGFALSKYPKIKTITTSTLKRMKTRPATGLYLVGINYVPFNYKKILAKLKLTLRNDGALVNSKGEKGVLFLKSKTVEVKRNGNKAFPYPFNYFTIDTYEYYFPGVLCAGIMANTWFNIGFGMMLPTNINFIRTSINMSCGFFPGSDMDICPNSSMCSSQVCLPLFWPFICTMQYSVTFNDGFTIGPISWMGWWP